VSGRRLVWVATALTSVLAAVTAVYGFLDDGTKLPAAEGGSVSGPGDLTFSLMVVAFSALGALLATRRPRNPIGWILCFASLALAVTGMARGWYVHAEYGAAGSQPAPGALLWFANWIFIWGFMPLMTALLLLFPDGKLPSRRWWPAGALTALALGTLTVGYALEPGALDSYPRADNPLGASGALGDAVNLLQYLGYPLFALAAIASAAALITRFRRSRGVERQQLKWMAAAAAVAVVAWFVNAVLDQAFGINSAFFLPIVLLAIPVAATVAILRYRLYDLGRIVNRTLVYVGLTATLGATYLGLVLLIGLTLGTSDVAIALATLAVAALFRPARTRIQAVVDRRFYRRRYDATRTLEAFGSRLRDEVDVDAVGAELRAAVRDTVQPAHLTLWLPSERRTT
jgi:hypothetical protein